MNQQEPITTLAIDRDLLRIALTIWPQAVTITTYSTHSKPPQVIAERYFTNGAIWKAITHPPGARTELTLKSEAKYKRYRTNRNPAWEVTIIKEGTLRFHFNSTFYPAGPALNTAPFCYNTTGHWFNPEAPGAFATLEKWIEDNT